MSSRHGRVLSVAGMAVFLAAARLLPIAAAADPSSASPQPTFTKDVLPIFQRSCQTCHRPGQMAPFSLVTYADARPWARTIREKVEGRYMPPWHLDRTVGQYDPDPSLSDAEIDTISRWVSAGAPQGDPRDAPPPVSWPANHSWTFREEPDLVATVSGFSVPATGMDLYLTSETPTGLTEDRYIKWMQVVPEHAGIVHHAIVTANQGDARPMLLSNFARGGEGDIFTEKSGTAKLLKAGATINIQDHLHPDGEHAVVERTKIGIKFFPKGYVPKHLIITTRISGVNSLAIAPGDANARSDAYFQLTQPARLVSFFPHMHYRGRRMTLEAILPNGQSRLLTDVNHFVWTWQLTYSYKEPLPTFPKGTVLHVTAYHDNSAANKENPDPSAFVAWGDRTVDEMNIGNVDYYYLTDEEYAALNKA
jgi:mono/diheme cytochrome c family protein